MATPVQERLRSRSLTPRVPAAGSPWVATCLAGSSREVPVIAAGPHAVYLQVSGHCLAVLDAHAIPVPLGLRTVLPRLPRVRTAVVGDGCVRLGPLTIELTRMVDPTVPRLRHLPEHAGVTRGWLRPGFHPGLDAAHSQLPAAALGALHDGDVSELVGLGDGFTPVGDDVVCGWLVTRHALGLRTDVDLPLRRTSRVSGSFLRRAALGEAVPQLCELLVAVGTGVGPEQVATQLDDLVQVGSSSGAGLAIGVAVALSPEGTLA